ncbi:MAG: trigger factor [Candidatus Hydrogenedentales bacterium]|jgi:trigger factor
MTEHEKEISEETSVNTEEVADVAESESTETEIEDVSAAEEAITDESVEEIGEDEFEWTEEPIFEIENKEACMCEVKVTIPAANLKNTLDTVYDEFNNDVQVPGFRRGKAPRKLLERRLGKFAKSTVVERLADAASRKLQRDHKLHPISDVDVEGLEEPEEIVETEDLVYTLSFEVAGSCELADYTQFVLEPQEVEVTDEQLDASVEQLRMRLGRFEPLTEGEAQDGDQVIIDFNGTIDGEAFEGNSAENYPYILGSGRFHENMEKALSGAVVDGELEAEVPFDADYNIKALAGKTALFKIKVNEIKRRVLPELDDEFAKKIGYDTMDALKESIKNDLVKSSENMVRESLRQEMLKKIVDESSFELPKNTLAKMADARYNEKANELTSQHVSSETIEEQQEQIKAEAEEEMTFYMKTSYAIDAAAKKESITISEEDVDSYLRDMNSGGGEEMFQLLKARFLSEENISNSTYHVLQDKTLDALIAKATVKPIPKDEWLKKHSEETSDDEESKQDDQS